MNAPQGQIIVSHALKQIQDLTAWQVRHFCLLPCSETEAEIFSLGRSITYSVNLLLRSCTCFQWQSTGIPCAHAIAAILGRREDPQAYVESFFTLEAYRKTSANAIHAPNADEIIVRTLSDPLSPSHHSGSHDDSKSKANRDRILPPQARRAPG